MQRNGKYTVLANFSDLATVGWLDAQPRNWAYFSASYINTLAMLRNAIDEFSDVQRGQIARGEYGQPHCEWTLTPLRHRIRTSVRECIDARRHMLNTLALNPCMNAR